MTATQNAGREWHREPAQIKSIDCSYVPRIRGFVEPQAVELTATCEVQIDEDHAPIDK